MESPAQTVQICGSAQSNLGLRCMHVPEDEVFSWHGPFIDRYMQKVFLYEYTYY